MNNTTDLLELPAFSVENHKVWKIMVDRQMKLIESSNKISKHLLTGLEIANLPLDRIPNVQKLSKRLHKNT